MFKPAKSKRPVLRMAIGLCLSLNLLPVLACGPFFDDAVFYLRSHPDAPMKRFLSGSLGVLEPTYARSYLIFAYRYLQDKPLTAAERASAYDLLCYRLGMANIDPRSEVSPREAGSGVDVWNNARKKVKGARVREFSSWDTFRNIDGEDYISYLNCTPDAFITAAATLDKRISTYGADSAEVKAWLEAQDQVFSHCSSSGYNYEKKQQNPPPPFPATLPATVPLAQRQDRFYQLAASRFYAGEFEVARALFREIAADKASPWHQIAEYMVARTYIREGTLAKDVAKGQKLLQQAMDILDGLMRKPEFASFSSSIEDLRHFLLIRLRRDGTFKDLSSKIVSDGLGDKFGKSVGDYTFILDRYFNESGDESSETHEIEDKKVRELVRGEDLSNWLWSFSDTSEAGLSEARSQYSSKKSLPWLLALATKIKGADKQAPELIKALAAVPQRSSGYIHARYHLARLNLERGAANARPARAIIDGVINSDIPPSARAKFATLKLETAADLSDFLSLSYVAPAAVVSGWNTIEMPENAPEVEKGLKYRYEKPLLLPLSADFINYRLNLSDFLKAAAGPTIPAGRKFDFAQAAFTRAFLLNDMAQLLKAQSLMKASQSAFARSLDIGAAASPEEKRFSAAFFLLQNPGARPYVTGGIPRATEFNHIDDYSDNWWGTPAVSSEGLKDCKVSLPASKGVDVELKTMQKTGAAPTFLSQVVLDFARNHPSDARVPEALHMVVKATRFGSGDDNTSKASAAAFKLLHSKYKGNPWTKKTPYHY